MEHEETEMYVSSCGSRSYLKIGSKALWTEVRYNEFERKFQFYLNSEVPGVAERHRDSWEFENSRQMDEAFGIAANWILNEEPKGFNVATLAARAVLGDADRIEHK